VRDDLDGTRHGTEEGPCAGHDEVRDGLIERPAVLDDLAHATREGQQADGSKRSFSHSCSDAGPSKQLPAASPMDDDAIMWRVPRWVTASDDFNLPTLGPHLLGVTKDEVSGGVAWPTRVRCRDEDDAA